MKQVHPKTMMGKPHGGDKSHQGGMVKDAKQPGKLPPHHCKEHKAR